VQAAHLSCAPAFLWFRCWAGVRPQAAITSLAWGIDTSHVNVWIGDLKAARQSD
jgi:hypothetical protein